MADKVHKVIVSNKTALTKKYQASGFTQLQETLQSLIAADAKRGLVTDCIWVDDAGSMNKFGGTPPISEKDERGNMAAVDAIANALSPDYIVLLDGPDIMPHMVLDNPLPNDGDNTIDSDLPYASPNGFSRQVSRFLKVTRVVGRIPNVPGAKDPKRIVSFLNTASHAAPKAITNYADYYGISAKVWEASTQMSLQAAFGNSSNLGIAPPVGPLVNDRNLSKLSHFINCHGAPLSPEFYGQSGDSFPVALTSAQVQKNVVDGTVVAAECCYGGQLYDPSLSNTADPICVSYLNNGSLGFLGSTNIAYGPPDFNGQADLIAQYFFESVLRGASLGRALLETRQQFITTQDLTNPANLKTLGQFLLLGDPSVQPCIAPKEISDTMGIAQLEGAGDSAAQREARRIELKGIGISVASGKAVPAGDGSLPDSVKARIWSVAQERGFSGAKEAVLAVRGAKDYRLAMKGRDAQQNVMIISQEFEMPHRVPGYRHLVAHVIGDKVARVEESVSR